MSALSTKGFLRYIAFPCLLYVILFFGGSEIIEAVFLDRVSEATIHVLHFVRGVFSVFFVAGMVLYLLSRAEKDFNHRMESICSLLSAANEGLIAFDSSWNVVSFNTRATEMLGSLDSGNFKTWVTEIRKQLWKTSQLECAGPAGDVRLRVVALQSYESGHLLLLQDITATKRMEEQWLITEKMASVGRMAAGLAHEIGTPLNVISGRAELIQSAQATICKECEFRPECAVEKHTRVIFQQIERISRIIHQLLAQARHTTQQQEPFSLNTCAHKVSEFLQHEMEKRHIQLHLHLQENLPSIYGYADQFQQVMINLVTNSMDALNGSGEIEVSTSSNNGGVDLAVADNGCGIAETDLTKIFDPFFTTKEFGKGTGLGLTVTSNIVRSHGGSIEVDSKPGRGTRFIIHMPT